MFLNLKFKSYNIKIVFPMDWSMDLNEEDDIDYPNDIKKLKIV